MLVAVGARAVLAALRRLGCPDQALLLHFQTKRRLQLPLTGICIGRRLGRVMVRITRTCTIGSEITGLHSLVGLTSESGESGGLILFRHTKTIATPEGDGVGVTVRLLSHT